MNTTLKITIFGAGAIGCTVAARLILSGFEQVSLIARGDNLKALKQDGIHLKDLTGEYHVEPYKVVKHVAELEQQDVICICTKADALAQITDQLIPLLKHDTVVIPLINGIPFWYFYEGQSLNAIKPIKSLDHSHHLLDQFPLQHLIGAVVFITAQLNGYGKVESNNPYLLIFGEPNNQVSERLNRLKAIFENTGIEARICDQIRDQIWTKVIANLSSNPLSVITGATLKDIYSHPHLHDITLQITHEIRQVAASYGARVSIDPHTFLQLGSNMGDVHTSMWYDYQKKQPLELKSIAEAVLELGQAYDCAMPMTTHICRLTQYLSEKSRGVKESV